MCLVTVVHSHAHGRPCPLYIALLYCTFQVMAGRVCTHYSTIRASEEEKKAFFSVLAGDLGLDHNYVATEAHSLLDLHFQVIGA